MKTEPTPQETAVTVAQPQPPAVFGGWLGPQDHWHSYDGEGLDRARFVSRCTNEETIPLKDAVGEVLTIAHYFAHMVPINQDDGSSVLAPRVVFETIDGVLYSSVSTGVARGLQALFRELGDSLGKEKIRIRPVKKKAKRGDFVSFVVEG